MSSGNNNNDDDDGQAPGRHGSSDSRSTGASDGVPSNVTEEHQEISTMTLPSGVDNEEPSTHPNLSPPLQTGDDMAPSVPYRHETPNTSAASAIEQEHQQLRDEHQQLRDGHQLLRDEKQKLRDEKQKLRDAIAQLNEDLDTNLCGSADTADPTSTACCLIL